MNVICHSAKAIGHCKTVHISVETVFLQKIDAKYSHIINIFLN